ncbi:hypothetical protein EYD45_04170 [Hyunsoonleella flava]|uniref:Uncharacterized protein n=2 Tax=Hyunsoonleella flava TaxID=2527939 RepID=A0A4Q9FGV3_9FLAO|nr:hypothetical protein EYD45_04170 [Hyunsoonleella flava]
MPFVESFLSTVKSNKSIMLDKSKHFRKTMGGYKWSGKDQFNFSEATPEQLTEVRDKLLKERKKRNIKLGIVLLVIVISIWIILSLK